MTTFPYNRDTPDGPNNPSNDQPKMKINTNSIDDLISVDHISFEDVNAPNGYHAIIHQTIQQGSSQRTWDQVARMFSPAVAAIPNVNQVFTALNTPNSTGAVSDTQLFSLTGLGGSSQLTGNLSLSDGYVWAGGLLFQWGTVTTATSGSFSSGAASGSVTFKDRVAGAIPFPLSCFVVIPVPFWTTASTAPDGSGSVNVNQTSVLNTGFSWKFNSNSGKYRGFYWFAVGI